MENRFRVRKARDFMNIEEQEAAYFARVLLVPRYKLLEVVYKIGHCYPWELIAFCSDYFQVPEAVIRVRLKDLGLVI